MTPPILRLATLAAVAVLLAACTATGGGTAVSGYGAVEGRTVPTIFGGSSGSDLEAARVPLSPDLAALLEPRGEAIAERAQFQALEETGAGLTVNWRTGDGGVRGTIVPGPVYAVNVQTCRDFRHDIELDGQRYSRRVTACRDDAGGWVPIS